jgi:hypothetical protein
MTLRSERGLLIFCRGSPSPVQTIIMIVKIQMIMGEGGERRIRGM